MSHTRNPATIYKWLQGIKEGRSLPSLNGAFESMMVCSQDWRCTSQQSYFQPLKTFFPPIYSASAIQHSDFCRSVAVAVEEE
ncbi:hypothetical protein ACLOJK_016254 [Asimina triloba]